MSFSGANHRVLKPSNYVAAKAANAINANLGEALQVEIGLIIKLARRFPSTISPPLLQLSTAGFKSVSQIEHFQDIFG
jgi:hypothetical protein